MKILRIALDVYKWIEMRRKKKLLLKCYRIEAKISRLVEYESSKHFRWNRKPFEACLLAARLLRRIFRQQSLITQRLPPDQRRVSFFLSNPNSSPIDQPVCKLQRSGLGNGSAVGLSEKTSIALRLSKSVRATLSVSMLARFFLMLFMDASKAFYIFGGEITKHVNSPFNDS